MRAKSRLCLTLLVSLRLLETWVSAGEAEETRQRAADRLRAYFRAETVQLAESCLTKVPTLEQWKADRPKLRQQLFEMLSLDPLPPRTDLQAVVTKRFEQNDIIVENLHFQSMPGLYVTANLYRPKGLLHPAPAILYLCGHAFVITNGVSYGNKTAYQHHGIWFARNGYVCLTIDTVQLGEIQGIHHGTYREGMWWWNARGYTSAGVEAWNAMRALDYLETRPEVDGMRLGVTGRSGGGAYSWWVAALDDRIKAAAPVAGMTDLRNHVIDGTVEGHCDCMFMVNTYRWDYPLVAALAAPKPLLICNSDKDSIFPLDGVERLHGKIAAVYKLYGATNNLGLLITEGPHQDTQDLQLPVFRWFNRHLKGEDPVIEMAAKRLFHARDLKVFEQIPAGQRTDRIHESFLPAAVISGAPANEAEWVRQRDQWRTALQEKVFRGWPREATAATAAAVGQAGAGRPLTICEFTSEHDVPLRLYVSTVRRRASFPNSPVRLTVLGAAEWAGWVKTYSRIHPDLLHDEAAALRLEPGRQDATVDEMAPLVEAGQAGSLLAESA
ncbi:MAG: prolyl oligopeptidase family serine peptidase [Verrucomicrobiota bacterium]